MSVSYEKYLIGMKKTVVVCKTLKQADILYERLIKMLKAAERTDYYGVKTRRTVTFKRVSEIRFTSERRWNQCYRYGFDGKIIFGDEFDKQLDREEEAVKKFNKARDLFFDELHNEKPERRPPKMGYFMCELCKKEDEILFVDLGGPYGHVPKYNTLKLTVNNTTDGNVYSYYCQHLCLECAESIKKHIASLEVPLNDK